MKLSVKLFGILMIISGISLLINPESFYGWVEDNMESNLLYIASIVVRLVLGPLFILAANESKFPLTFKIFGSLVVISAIIFIFMGHDSFNNYLSILIPDIKPYAPMSGVIDIAMGGFFIYACSGNKESKQELN